MTSDDQVLKQDGSVARHGRYRAIDQNDKVSTRELSEFGGNGAVDLRRSALLVPDSLAVEKNPRRHLLRHERRRGKSPTHTNALDQRGHQRAKELAIVLIKRAKASEEFDLVFRIRDLVRDRP